MSNRTITIAIPVYNCEKYIRESIISANSQTTTINEIIVIDDGSTDNTMKIINELLDEIKPKKIKVLENKENIGYEKTWNKCFEFNTSKFVILLHADDILKSNTADKLLNFFRLYPELAVVGGYQDFINMNGSLTFSDNKKTTSIYQKGEIYEFVKETGSYIPSSGVMFDMEKIIEVGGFDTGVLATDELYWPKVLTKFPIAVLGESLIYRRIHPEQTANKDYINKTELIINSGLAQYKIADFEKRPELRKKIKRLIQKKNARNGVKIAFKIRKKPKMFIKYLLFSLNENPSIIFTKLIWREFYHVIIK